MFLLRLWWTGWARQPRLKRRLIDAIRLSLHRRFNGFNEEMSGAASREVLEYLQDEVPPTQCFLNYPDVLNLDFSVEYDM
jgi:hypothetical protein